MAADQVNVRLAQIIDIPALVSLMHDFYMEADFPLDRDWAAAAFRTLLTNPALGRVWIAMTDGTCMGYVVLSVRFAMEYGGMSAYMDDLYVRPAFRGQGVTTALLNTLSAYCKSAGCKSLHVEVGTQNLPARELYARYGLQPGTAGRVMLSTALPEAGT